MWKWYHSEVRVAQSSPRPAPTRLGEFSRGKGGSQGWGEAGWIYMCLTHSSGLPQWPSSKESACNAGVTGSVPGLGRSPGGRHGNPLRSSCLENPMDRGAWWTTVQGAPKSQTQLKRRACTHAPTYDTIIGVHKAQVTY